jgi:iron complex transport system substrate-binding protein
MPFVSRKDAKIFKRANMDQELERMASTTIDCALAIHIDVGPGLLENVYEGLLAQRLQQAGLKIDRQMPVKAIIQGLVFPEAFRLDILVEKKLLIEIKSVEKIVPVHAKQTLTYLRLMKLPLGLLINFGGMTLKEGLKRIANNYGFKND